VGLFALAACGPSRVSPPPAPVQPQPDLAEPDPLEQGVRVGLLLPLSGPAEALGQDMLRAAEMALFDVGENDIVLLPRDTAGSALEARGAAEEVIAEGADLILGPLFSQAVGAVGPVAALADVPVLAFSNVTAAADPPTTFVLGFRPEEQVHRVVDHALRQGLVRIAGLAPDDAYGRTALAALEEAVIASGGELGEVMFYPPDLADPSDVVRQVAAYGERRYALEQEKARVAAEPGGEARLRELENLDTFGPPPFDAILIADGGSRVRSVAALLTFFDVSPEQVRFLGTMRWQDDPLVLEEDSLRGGWFAGPSPSRAAAFSERFERAFGTPPQQLASLAYDATALAVIVARDLGDPAFSVGTLTGSQGFEGATGLFRLRPEGIADHGLAVLEVQDGTATAIDPAPSRFEDLIVTTTPPAGPGAMEPGTGLPGVGVPGLDPLPGAEAAPRIRPEPAPLERVIVPQRAPPPGALPPGPEEVVPDAGF